MSVQISIKKLSRHYNRRSGLRNLWASESHTALHPLSLTIEAGSRVALVGPNGAGKSTLIKLLCGIIAPSAGELSILGRQPHTDRQAHVRHIGVVFGQRSQLAWDVSPRHTYRLLAALHEIPTELFETRLTHYTEIFEANNLIEVPTRQLSLGQRMRCDLIAALLHNPSILLLDEPSIGLDLRAKAQLHGCLRRYTDSYSATLLMSSHDIEDIELCERVLILNEGQLMLDTTLKALHAQYGRHPIRFTCAHELPETEGIQKDGDHYRCESWSKLLMFQRNHPDYQIENISNAPFRLGELLKSLMP